MSSMGRRSFDWLILSVFGGSAFIAATSCYGIYSAALAIWHATH